MNRPESSDTAHLSSKVWSGCIATDVPAIDVAEDPAVASPGRNRDAEGEKIKIPIETCSGKSDPAAEIVASEGVQEHWTNSQRRLVLTGSPAEISALARRIGIPEDAVTNVSRTKHALGLWDTDLGEYLKISEQR